MRRKPSTLVRLSLAVAAAATACSSAGPSLGASDSAGPAATSTTAPDEQAATGSSPTDPTSAQGDFCVIGLTGNPTTVTGAVADFDGDGASDQITVYATGIASDPWHVRVDTAAGESLDSSMGPDVLTGANVGPLGGADADGDGASDELFIVIGAGASSTIVGIYNRVGCEIAPVTLNGSRVGFPVGGSIGNIGGLECIDADGSGTTDSIIAWSGSADFDAGEGQYVIEGVEYRLAGVQLEQVGTRALTANISQADFVYGSLTCGSVSL